MDWTREDCEIEAALSHHRAIGQVVAVQSLDIFVGGTVEQYLARPPLRVRVLQTPTDFMLLWNEDYLDARWYVEPLDHREKVTAATSIWIYDPVSWHVGEGPI
jgi:hypothetical protein